jgi:hypothetical protein
MNKGFKDATSQAAGSPESACAAFVNGLEQLTQLQKKAVEFAVEQNTQAVESYKRAFPSVPGMFLMDLASQTFERCAAAQNRISDLMVEQAAAMIKLCAAPSESMFKVPGDLVEQSVDRGVAAQKTALDVASQQNKAVCDTVKQQMPNTPAAAAAESVQRGVETLIETHKNLLDIAAKPIKSAATQA